MKILTNANEKTYTTSDGIERTFKPFFWPDMLKLGKLFPYVNDVFPGANFLDLSEFVGEITGAELSSKAYSAMIEIFAVMFSPKYCNKPLTKEDIEQKDIVNVFDIVNLIRIAAELAGMQSLAGDADASKEAQPGEKKSISKRGSKKT